MKLVNIHNQSQNKGISIKARYCRSFFCRLRGLMFSKSLGKHEGLFMIQARADRVDASIHMLFMAYDLTVVWIDDNYRIVDVKLCRKWRPAYFPAFAARYVLETHVDRFNDFKVGDQLVIEI